MNETTGQFAVTVIIPNYNNEKYIENCINSVLSQTYPETYVLVVDDCSTDSSRDIIRSMQGRSDRLSAVFLEKNGGVSNARNTGAHAAQTDYVTFLDGDDFYYNPDKLTNEMQLIKEYHKKGIDIVAFSPVLIVDNQGANIVRKQSLKKTDQAHGDAKLQLISRSVIMPRDYCIKKSVLLDVGAYSFYKNFYEDMDLLMRLSFVVPFYCTFQYGTAYRHTPAGLSKRTEEEHISTVKEITDRYQERLRPIEKKIVRIKGFQKRVKNKLRRCLGK